MTRRLDLAVWAKTKAVSGFMWGGGGCVLYTNEKNVSKTFKR